MGKSGNKLFVLPDNIPDCLLKRDMLDRCPEGSGLAAEMRPKQSPEKVVGKSDPVYPIPIVGVPTVIHTFHTKIVKDNIEDEEDKNINVASVTEQQLIDLYIPKAFAKIRRLMELGQYENLVVPYVTVDNVLQPAFGTGFGLASDAIKNKIKDEFSQLESELVEKQKLKSKK